MNLKKIESNYCCVVVQLNNFVELSGLDKLQSAIILNNHVIVSKEIKNNDVGLFFPIETKLSNDFLKNNNLYSNKDKNIDVSKKGYFGDTGRVRCQRFQGNKSEGFYIPLNSLSYLLNYDNIIKKLKIGDEFQFIDDIEICRKYSPKQNNQLNKTCVNKTFKKIKKFNKVIDQQFKFHFDTAQFKRNTHKIKPDDIISITYKMHGTSGVTSKILTNKKLNIKNKIAKFFGCDIIDKQYDYIYSSRTVIKNKYDQNKKLENGYYNKDLWGIATEILKPYLLDGMTFYYEIVGYISENKYIQKNFDYSCEPNKFEIYIYRITYINQSNNIIEMPFKQMCEYVSNRGLKHVPIIYYGYAKDYIAEKYDSEESFSKLFLDKLESSITNKKCYMCKNKVPMEGYVIRKDFNLEYESFKLKNYAFLEMETKNLDEDVEDLESAN